MLTDDELELTILEIAAQGQSIAPINAWEQPVLRLCEQGFLRKMDAFNYVITAAGKAEFEKREHAELAGVVAEQRGLRVKIADYEGPIIEGEVIRATEEDEG